MHEQDRQSGNPASQTGTALKNSAEGLGSVFWRHKWLILVVLAVGLAGGGVYLALVKPEYTSTSRLHVQSQSTTILKGQESPADLPLTFLPTQVELIRSQETLQSVLETIGLENLPSVHKAEDPHQALERMIRVTIPARNNLIDIKVRSNWPEEASRLANTLAEVFQARKQQSDSAAMQNLLDERDRREARLNEDLRRLADFQDAYGRADLDQDNGAAMRVNFMSQLSLARTEAELELVNARFEYELSLQVAEDPEKLRKALIRQESPEALPQAAREYYLTKELETAHKRLDRLKMHYTGDHPAVVEAAEELKNIENRVDELKETMAEGFVAVAENRYEMAKQRMARIQETIADEEQEALKWKTISSRYTMLQQNVDRSQEQLDSLVNRIGELDATGNETSLVKYRLIQHARPADEPTWPKPGRILLLAGALGLACGLAMAVFLDWTDKGYRNPIEISQDLNLPVLSTVPHVSGRLTTEMMGQRVRLDPTGAMAEAIRILRTGLHFATRRGSYKSLLVSSPTSGDGKSVIASNLAIAMADAGRKVLLIDADTLNPTQHKIFGVGNPDTNPGCAADGKVPSLERMLIRPSGVANLDIVCGGALLRAAMDVLGEDGYDYLLKRLGRQYDKVIVDAAPALPVAEARGLAVICDRTLLIVRSGKTNRAQSTLTCQTLLQLGAQVMGLVVNAAKASTAYGYGMGGYLSGRQRRRAAGKAISQAAFQPQTTSWKDHG